MDLVGRAGTFLNGVFSPAAQELGHLFGEQMRFWRFRNGVRILEKAQALVEERGLKPEQIRALGFGEGLLLLETASLEEDDTVQAMWARLVANAVDPNCACKPEKVYVELLKSLSSKEVTFLDLLWKIEEGNLGFRSTADYNRHAKLVSEAADERWRRFPSEDRSISIQNLVRLRCITFAAKPIDVRNLAAFVPTDNRNPFGTKWAVVDPKKLENVIRKLSEQHLVATGLKDFPGTDRPMLPGALPEASFVLTPLGKGLLRACKENGGGGSKAKA